MKIGSLVELVDDRWTDSKNIIRPIKKVIYTVRGFDRLPISTPSIFLEEIENAPVYYSNGYGESSFKITRFRELLPPMQISIEIILEKEIV